ncbi:hypothetical protein QFZ55_000218 [Streptomyces luteogriseus]|uniref:hypothetical protein n=1 Tax=Streptomyces luteogriseus TaxID=68233 RepID=UPI002781F4E3|nr:hypothetical protein [Streptomyces luteogriseus]MDQ0710766.1 hypothetical protein [Streptomyces luteogriseus]
MSQIVRRAETMATVTTTTDPHAFVDWTSRESDRMAIGTLLGRTVTITGQSENSVGEVNTNREHTDFHWPAFTPSLSTSDSVGLIGKTADTEFTIELGTKVREVVLHLGSLASTLTLAPDATVTRVSGDDRFEVFPPNVVRGWENTPGQPTDSNGTVLVTKSEPFSALTFKLKKNYAAELPDDGVYLQIGRIVRFADWTSRESNKKAVGTLLGRTVKITGQFANSVGEVNINGQHTDFHWPAFTPSLSTSDSVELIGKTADTEFTIDLGTEVREVFLHLGSLASTVTFFEPGTTVTEVSGDEHFEVRQLNVVQGQENTAGRPTDSNGTVRVTKSEPFRELKFKLKKRYAAELPDDGVYLQIGR